MDQEEDPPTVGASPCYQSKLPEPSSTLGERRARWLALREDMRPYAARLRIFSPALGDGPGVASLAKEVKRLIFQEMDLEDLVPESDAPDSQASPPVPFPLVSEGRSRRRPRPQASVPAEFEHRDLLRIFSPTLGAGPGVANLYEEVMQKLHL